MTKFKLGDRVLVLKRAGSYSHSPYKPWYEGDVTGVSETALRVSQPLRMWGKVKWRLIHGGGIKIEKVSA